MITVVTPTARPDGIKITGECLARQTIQDFEWLVVSPEKYEAPIPYTWIKDPPKTHKFWPLNACYQLALDQAKGDVYVSIQDHIWFPPTALEKFAFHIRNTKGMVSGIGDIYGRIENGKPEFIVWTDPRKRLDQGTFYECTPQDIEMNYCAYPTDKLLEIGGFAVDLDALGYDPVNIDIADRLDNIGVKPYLDQTNECRGLRHEKHPADWDANFTVINGKWLEWKKSKIESGNWPILGGGKNVSPQS